MGLSHSPQIVTKDLVLCIDASDVKSYPGSGTTVYDRSSNNNGELQNGVGYSNINNGTFVFDGVDDCIQTSYGPALNDFTACVWFRSTGGTRNYNRILDKSFNTGLWIGRNNGITNSWGGGVRESSSPYGRYITLEDNKWHLIVSRRLGTTHTILGDGIKNRISGTVSNTALSTTTFAFGNYSGINSVNRLTGNIAHVSIYNRALTDDEILQNFNAHRGRFGL